MDELSPASPLARRLEGCTRLPEEDNGIDPAAQRRAETSHMVEMDQPTAERTIEQAPQWLRDLMTPTGDLAASREEARRYLAGDRTARVAPLDDVDALFDDAGGRGAA